jgi:hypothetical protein
MKRVEDGGGDVDKRGRLGDSFGKFGRAVGPMNDERNVQRTFIDEIAVA